MSVFIENIISSVNEINKNNKRNFDIFITRFGFDDGKYKSLNEVALKFNLSRERIRQIINRIFKRIKYKYLVNLKNNNPSSPCFILIQLITNVFDNDDTNSQLDFIELNLGFMSIYKATLLLLELTSKISTLRNNLSNLYNKYLDIKQESIKHESAKKKLDSISKDIIWFNKTMKTNVDYARNNITKQRDINFASTYISKKGIFFSKKLNRDVCYESYIEYTFLIILENCNDIVFYQEQPFIIPYTKGGKEYNYYPDVFFVFNNGHGVITEIKPKSFMSINRNMIKYRALWKYCKENGYGFLVTDARNISLKTYLNFDLNPDFENEIMSILKEKEFLKWADYKVIKNKYSATIDSLNSLIIKNKLEFSFFPFMIKRD